MSNNTLLSFDKASKTVSKVHKQLVSLAIAVMAIHLDITIGEVKQLLEDGQTIDTDRNRYQYESEGSDGSV